MNTYYSFPNQRIVQIHRNKELTDFLGIQNTTWKAACRDLNNAYATVLYLYFASNADGFNKALSPKAIKDEIGMAASTYHDQFHYLREKGYLVDRGNNRFDFYETPQKRETETQIADAQNNNASGGYDWDDDLCAAFGIRKNVQADSQEDIEIDNINGESDNSWKNNYAEFFGQRTEEKAYTEKGFVF